MPKVIQIEYCGGWGYGWRAARVRDLLQQNFPTTKINYFSLMATGKIEVFWVKDGKKEIVWSGGRQDTQKN